MLVATAGHVDHGKTSLVERLTGTNTDRLAQEKLRGITIELGYAFCEAGSNDTIGFIDVPGHHRFINTMISGINGIDLGMLLVAADNGPMPQTLDHLQLLRLLGVERFAGVISKSDLVDRARLDEVAKQVGALIPGAPLCKISNRTGEGLEQLQSLLDQQLRNCPARVTQAQFRMHIDRVFIKKGAALWSQAPACRVPSSLKVSCDCKHLPQVIHNSCGSGYEGSTPREKPQRQVRPVNAAR